MDSIPTLRLLIKLQDLDRDLRRVESHERAIPDILSKRGRQRQELLNRGEAKHAEILKARAQFKESEVEMQTRDQQLEKLKVQLNLAKTNQEYSAILDQTKRIGEERGKVEDAGLEMLQRIDEMVREEQSIKAELEAANREFGTFAAQMEKDLAAYREEHEEIKQRRAALQAELDQQALVLYERVLAARGGVAVVPVVARICQGCYLTLTPNDLVNLQAGYLVVCKSCQRILYLPETLGLTKA